MTSLDDLRKRVEEAVRETDSSRIYGPFFGTENEHVGELRRALLYERLAWQALVDALTAALTCKECGGCGIMTGRKDAWGTSHIICPTCGPLRASLGGPHA